MKRFIAAFIFGSISMLAADAAAPAPAPVPVSPALRANYWHAATVVQDADYKDKVAHDELTTAVQAMRSECWKDKKELSQDAKAEPVCVSQPEVKKDAVKK